MQSKRALRPVIVAGAAIAVIVILAVLLLQGGGGSRTYKNKAEYYGMTSEDQVPLIVDDAISENFGKVIDGQVYVDYMTAWDLFNSAFYWSEEEQQLQEIMPAGTLSWTADDSGDLVIDEEGTVYLSAELIRQNSDIDLAVYEEPLRIVARTSWTGLTTATATEEAAVREKAGSRSEILTDLAQGDHVVCLDSSEEWYLVSTEDGCIGYLQGENCQIDQTCAITHTSDEAYSFSHVMEEGRVTLAWQYVEGDAENSILGELLTEVQGLGVVSPTWFSPANGAGDLNSTADAAYVETAHGAGLRVWALIGDVSGGETDTNELLASAAARSHMIEQLMTAAEQYGFDGINVDFETITYDGAPAYLQFLKELCLAAHERGLTVSTDNYVPTYTAYYKRGEQARTVDYIIIMGYEEHSSDSAEPGSVASLPFVEDGIVSTLAEVPADQVINAVPFYTRSWTEPFGSDMLYSDALGMDAGRAFAEEMGISLAWDDSVGQYTGSATDEEARYSIWLEDAESMAAKLDLAKQYELAGVAAWRLGLESSDVWPLFADYLAGEN